MIKFEGKEFFNVVSLKVYLYTEPMVYCNDHITIAEQSLYVSCADTSLLKLKARLIDKIIKGCTKEYDCGYSRFEGTKEEVKAQVFAKIDQSDITFKEGKPFVFGIGIEDGGMIKDIVRGVKERIGKEIDKL